MQSIRHWAGRRHRLPLPAAIGLIAAVSLFSTLLSFRISPVQGYVFRSLVLWSGGLVILVNWIPVFLLMLLLYFAFANLVAAIAPVLLTVIVMAAVNRVKLTLRGDPLVHWDLAMVKEATNIAGALDTRMITLAVLGVVLFIGVSVALAFLLRTRKPPLRQRLIGLFVALALAAAANALLLSSPAIYKALPVWGSFYNLADVHNSKGNLYAFLYNWNTSRSHAPDGYDAQAIQRHAGEYAAPDVAPDTPLPNIVMIMGEAFSDLSRQPVFSFDGLQNPTAAFDALCDAGISGHLVVPSRGGGTADTEYDVLTGRAARFSRGAPYAYRTLIGPIDALPSLLKGEGYQTYALHPGHGWFYNRQNVYPWLGFDTVVFEDAFLREAYLDTFMREDATFDRLLADIAAQKAASDKPLFAFCLTIQNHGGYLDRYVQGGLDNFATTIALTGEERNILSNYFYGVQDADAQIARLAAFLDAQAEPYVLVYFGDHLPALEPTLYDKLIPGADAPEGSFAQLTRLYSVPFVLWPNAAARAQGILADASSGNDLPANRTISSNYLGAYVLAQLGLDVLSPYMHYANTVRKSAPVIMEAAAFDAAENPIAAGSEVDKAIRMLQGWAYWLQTGG